MTQTTRASFLRVICNFAKLSATSKIVSGMISSQCLLKINFRGDVENCRQVSVLQQDSSCGITIDTRNVIQYFKKSFRNLKVKRSVLIFKKMKMEECPTQSF